MIIDWARHGESCANFLEFKITDLIDNDVDISGIQQIRLFIEEN